ncbi:MAG: hypothetical protein ACYTEL_06960 [Planctomycetota bacterium]|jgi:hypothetical protein
MDATETVTGAADHTSAGHTDSVAAAVETTSQEIRRLGREILDGVTGPDDVPDVVRDYAAYAGATADELERVLRRHRVLCLAAVEILVRSSELAWIVDEDCARDLVSVRECLRAELGLPDVQQDDAQNCTAGEKEG